MAAMLALRGCGCSFSRPPAVRAPIFATYFSSWLSDSLSVSLSVAPSLKRANTCQVAESNPTYNPVCGVAAHVEKLQVFSFLFNKTHPVHACLQPFAKNRRYYIEVKNGIRRSILRNYLCSACRPSVRAREERGGLNATTGRVSRARGKAGGKAADTINRHIATVRQEFLHPSCLHSS